MAKGRLGKTEKYVIEGMFEDGNSFEEIAKETGRTPATIEKHLRAVAAEAEAEETANGKEQEDETPGKNKGLFVRKTMLKNNKGVSIMTEAESSRGDATAGKNQSKIKKRFQPVIHTIDPDKK